MSHLLKKALALAMITSFVSLGFLEAYCAKCTRIEQNRAKEQAAHPQIAGYYEDFQANLNSKHSSQSSEVALADDNQGTSDDSDDDDSYPSNKEVK